MRKVAALMSASMPTPSPETLLTTMASAPLRSSLARPFSRWFVGFGGEADDELAGAAAADNLGENVLSRREFERERAGALELVFGDDDGAVVGDGGGFDDQRGFGHAGKHGVRIWSAVVTLTSSQWAGGCSGEGR